MTIRHGAVFNLYEIINEEEIFIGTYFNKTIREIKDMLRGNTPLTEMELYSIHGDYWLFDNETGRQYHAKIYKFIDN